MPSSTAKSLVAELAWLKVNPQFEERPATLREFLGPDYLNIETKVRLSIQDVLSDIMGEKVSGEKPTVFPLAMFTGAVGIGKGHRSRDTLASPSGEVKVKDIKVGDYVIGSDGTPTKVTGVYPRGVLPVYRVTFKDRTSLVVDGDHLWAVDRQTRERGNTKRVWKREVVSTAELMKRKLKYDDTFVYKIPLVQPIHYDKQELKIHPYLMGAVIANGHASGSVRVAAPGGCEWEFEKRLADLLPKGVVPVVNEPGARGGNLTLASYPTSSSNPVLDAFRDYGLGGVTSRDKFIPEPYLLGSPEDRLDLLRGLMDCDGSSFGRNSSSYSTSSQRLANDVARLVRSLGGYCTITDFDRRGTIEYQVHVNMDQVCPFNISRKKDNWKPRTNQHPARVIVSIEPEGEEEVICISVEAEDSLYVAGEELIVTHNTTVASIVLPYLCHWVLCLKDPQEFYDLLPGTRIAFMQMSTSESQAKEVVFGDIKARIANSPWFKKYPTDKNFKNQIRFSKDIWILPGDSAETTFEGYNILGGILDEADSHKVTKTKDYAQIGYDTISARITSRFEDKGFLLIVGQMKKSVGFAKGKFDEFSARPDAYAAQLTIWESMGWDHYKDKVTGEVETFHYDSQRKMIVPEALVSTMTSNRDVIEIPKLFINDFRNNPEKALRDLAGIPPLVGDAFISLPVKINDARDRWVARHGGESPLDATGRFQPWFKCNDSLKRVGHLDIAYCVDDATEVLTQRGWLRQDEVRVGDMALVLDEKTHLSRWEPVLSVNRFEGSGKMLSIEGASHSSLTTANHRWLVDQRTWIKETRRYVGTHPSVVTSSELSGKNSIVLAAACEDFPTEQKYSDSFVELVAWFWTEGHINKLRDGSRSSNVEIYQSSSVNPLYCERIRKCLNEVFGPPVDKFPRLGGGTDGVPRWREYLNQEKVCWYLSSDAGRTLLEQAPNRLVRQEFILSLTESQLRLFADVSIWADGNSPNEIAQKDSDALDSMQLVWVLLGRATNKYKMASGMTMLGSSEKRIRLKFKKSNTEWVDYEGIVWCPTTPSGSWLARRNGKTYFTGNSGEGDALGFAMGHVREVVKIDGELKPYIIIDLLMRVKAPSGSQVMLGDIRRTIYSLRDSLGFKLGRVTTDGFECLTGDTEVPLLDGRTLTMEELARDYPNGGFETYSYNGKRIVPGVGLRAWRTGRRSVVTVVLDNGEKVRCTADHPWMLRDGTYRSASELSPGDSLMPLYRRITPVGWKGLEGYEQVRQPGRKLRRGAWGAGRWQYTHRLVSICKSGDVVHHKNHNRLDNSSVNLVSVSRSDHSREHNVFGDLWRNDAEWSEGTRIAVSEANKKRVGVEACRRRHDITMEDCESVSHLPYRGAMEELGCSQDLLYARVREAGFLGWSDFRSKRNHRVVTVLDDGEMEDVYDLEIEDHHNFAIGAGVFVHNSTDTKQQFNRRKIVSEHLSVDKDVLPYHDLREALYEDRIEFPPYFVKLNPGDTEVTEILIKELGELVDQGMKIDHPPKGSKDLADAVAGVAHTLMGNRSYHKKVISIDTYRQEKLAVGQSSSPYDHPAFNGLRSGNPTTPLPPPMPRGRK